MCRVVCSTRFGSPDAELTVPRSDPEHRLYGGGSGPHFQLNTLQEEAPGSGTRAGPGQDRSYTVLTVRHDRIVAMRDCRDRQAALEVAGGFEAGTK